MDASQDTVFLDAAPGDRLRCVGPRTAKNRSTLYTAVVGVSLLLGCELVLARHWLPGIHLFVQVDHHLRRPGRTLVEGVALEWLRLEQGVMARLNRTDGDEHLVVRLRRMPPRP